MADPKKKKKKPKPSDLGSGQAAKAAGLAIRRNERVRSSTAESLQALNNALGIKPKSKGR